MEEISEYFQQHEQGLAAQELFRNQLTNLYETILYYIWVTCLLVEVQNFLLYVPIKVEQICAVIETIGAISDTSMNFCTQLRIALKISFGYKDISEFTL